MIQFAAQFHRKARLFVQGRQGLWQSLAQDLANNNLPLAWFHAASLGEFEQTRPLIEQFRIEFPNYKILLTFFSPSGYEIRKNYEGADYVYYLPIDSDANAKKWIKIVKPSVVFFAKYEFWYYYLKVLKQNQIPAFSFSAIFRSNQVFFKWYGGFYRNILRCFEHIFVQDESSIKLLSNYGFKNITKCGDTRIDRVLQLAQQPKELPIVASFKSNQPIFILGSAWQQDMEIILPVLQRDYPNFKIIIAPHEVTETNVQKADSLVMKAGSVRYSQVLPATDLANTKVLIIDNIGLLSSIYRYCNVVAIGGGFGRSIHNTLEPATYGLPIFFGPRYGKFKEAVDMLALRCAFTFTNQNEFATQLKNLMQGNNLAEAGERSAKYIKDNLGATSTIINYCKKLGI